MTNDRFKKLEKNKGLFSGSSKMLAPLFSLRFKRKLEIQDTSNVEGEAPTQPKERKIEIDEDALLQTKQMRMKREAQAIIQSRFEEAQAYKRMQERIKLSQEKVSDKKVEVATLVIGVLIAMGLVYFEFESFSFSTGVVIIVGILILAAFAFGLYASRKIP